LEWVGVVLRSTISALVVLLMAGFAAAQQAGPVPDVNTIVSRMVAAWQENKAHAHAYTVKRDYQLLDKQSQPKAQVIANITVMPPDQKEYRIESSSGGMGEKVLRDILEHETESSNHAQRKEISPENYEFALLGQESLDGRRCYVIALNPKRDDKNLIKGKMWVDAASYNVHRIEGNPAKSPSWWIRDLHILMSFADVDGMWLHTFTHAVADVRFKGKYVMESRDLEYRSAEQASRRHRNPGILAGAAINP
jgi:outer membrane lipoprotein-sorting protein